MLILGLTGGIDPIFESFDMINTGLGHDSSAVLIEHGKVIAGIEEERLNRIKHSNKVWASSVRFCLESANKSLDDIDAIAFYASEDFLNNTLKKFRLTTPLLDQFPDVRHLYQYLFEREFGYKLNPQIFQFIHHHLAHAAATYYMSGFDRSLVLTIDGEAMIFRRWWSMQTVKTLIY